MLASIEIAAGAALAMRWLKPIKLSGVTVLAVGLVSLANPAFADESVVAIDNGTVACSASLKDLTRISLKDDQFASVSKVAVDNPADDFQVVNEPLRGDIYVSVPAGFTRPLISFFGTTRKGFTYKFVCQVGGEDAKQVFVANPELAIPQAAAADLLPANLMSPVLSGGDVAGRLISAMYAQKPVEGFDVSWRALTPVAVGSLSVQLVGEYVGTTLVGDRLKLVNQGTRPIVLTEEQVAPRDAVAVSIMQPRLASGEATTAFVVVRRKLQGEQQ